MKKKVKIENNGGSANNWLKRKRLMNYDMSVVSVSKTGKMMKMQYTEEQKKPDDLVSFLNAQGEQLKKFVENLDKDGR